MLEVTKKKILVPIVLMLVFIEIICCFLLWNNDSGKTTKLEDVKLKEEVSSNDLFAIKVEQSDGSYKDETTIPLKENGYIFNADKSICMDADGQTVNDVLAYRNNMVKIDVRGTTYCYLYFDLISDGDFCIEQGITDFSDCLLVMEDYSYDTAEAIDYINSKGSATTENVAPTVTYAQKSSKQTGDSVISTTANFTLGKSYEFNSSTGQYTLKNYVTTTMNDSYLGYYTCGSTTSGSATCSTMYKINAYTKTVGTTSTTYKVTDADVYTFSATDSFDSEVGLYATNDADGITYFYRGAVKNNYVYFGGFYWRVVRINGDGTVRMIYAGTSATESGTDDQIGTKQYNAKYYDPTYVGYTYDDASRAYKENTTLTTYTNMTSTAKYYYGTSLDCTTYASSKQCVLSGNTKSAVWSESYSSLLSDGYKYTCFSTSATAKCNFAFKIDSYVSASSAKGYYISFNSPDYATTLKDTTDSTVKDYLDTWYENNLLNTTDSKGVKNSNYIDTNAEFCNDRQFYQGSGYLMSPTTYYNAYNRINNQRKPSLLCGQSSDIYSVAKGNLDYPVALLTIDEASFAGGRVGYVNNQYYLYTGQHFWTMSPSLFFAGHALARVWYVSSTGQLAYNWAAGSYGVRPVINLKSNVLITQGIGTAENPYILTMS